MTLPPPVSPSWAIGSGGNHGDQVAAWMATIMAAPQGHIPAMPSMLTTMIVKSLHRQSWAQCQCCLRVSQSMAFMMTIQRPNPLTASALLSASSLRCCPDTRPGAGIPNPNCTDTHPLAGSLNAGCTDTRPLAGSFDTNCAITRPLAGSLTNCPPPDPHNGGPVDRQALVRLSRIAMG